MKDERVYLLHAIEAIDAISSYTVDGREACSVAARAQDEQLRLLRHDGRRY